MELESASVVLGALAGGAVRGLQDSATAAVKDAYQLLRDLLANRLRGNRSAEAALEGYLEEPEVWRRPLEQSLERTGALADPEVLAATRLLLEQLGEAAPAPHVTYVSDSSGVQVNHQGGNVQHNTFRS
ncbi:hypothetical protein ABT344_28625 [Micromonospora carbonacea]|uniref:hypothetical protein n=1 Tax=Micromonospora carbonacea TaxID=47853 RepID=UPI003331AA53